MHGEKTLQNSSKKIKTCSACLRPEESLAPTNHSQKMHLSTHMCSALGNYQLKSSLCNVKHFLINKNFGVSVSINLCLAIKGCCIIRNKASFTSLEAKIMFVDTKVVSKFTGHSNCNQCTIA